MPRLRQLKYGKTLLVLAIIDLAMSFLSLLATYFLLLYGKDINDKGYGSMVGYFVFTATTSGVSGLIMLIAGIKSRYSKAWTIFLLVTTSASVIFSLVSLILGQITIPIVAILIFVNSILNIKDDKVRIAEFEKELVEYKNAQLLQNKEKDVL